MLDTIYQNETFNSKVKKVMLQGISNELQTIIKSKDASPENEDENE